MKSKNPKSTKSEKAINTVAQLTQSKNWAFTDFKLLDIESIYNNYKDIIRYIAFGRERCPTTGKEHNQGWVQFVNKKRFNGVLKIFDSKSLHIEPCRGSEIDNDKYCAKDKIFKSFGKFISMGERTDIEQLKLQLNLGTPLLEIASDNFGAFLRYSKSIKEYRALVLQNACKNFRKVEVVVLQGKTGTGKTRRAMEEAKFKIEGGKLQWWDGYEGEKCICIDEFANQIPITELLNLLDGYQLRLPVKGAHTYANWEKVFITTNLKKHEWYPLANEEHKRALFRRITDWQKISIPKNLKPCRGCGEGNTIALPDPEFIEDSDFSMDVSSF